MKLKTSSRSGWVFLTLVALMATANSLVQSSNVNQSGNSPSSSAATQADEKSSVPLGAQSSSATPTTTTIPETKNIKNIDSLLEPPPLPKSKVSLIGGTVHSIDQIRNKIVVDVFGKGRMKVSFDERSHVYHNGIETTQLAIHKGDHVHLDTQLSNGKIFARSVQVLTNPEAAAISGQIISVGKNYDVVTVRDSLSSQPLVLTVSSSTMITQAGKSAAKTDLLPGSLVTARFNPVRGQYATASEIELLARRGAQFTFYGTLTYLDLRSGILALDNKSDNKVYEVKFSPQNVGVTDTLTVGAEVAVSSVFNGRDYEAQTVKVTQVATNKKPDENR